MKLEEGSTFLYRYPKSDMHLFIVITGSVTVRKTLMYTCSMISSWKDNSPLCDPACIIEAGEHPFITHKSYVAYKETVQFSEEQLNKLFLTGKCIPRDSVTDTLLRRIKAGASKSRKIAPFMLDFFKN